jgi:thioredoxin reductase (NADPH)
MQMSSPSEAEAFPVFDVGQLSRFREYGQQSQVGVGELLFQAGQPTYDLIILVNAAAETFRRDNTDGGEVILAQHGPGNF